MTRDGWLQELDALACEKVLGHQRKPMQPDIPSPPSWMYPTACIEDAWLLVEKMEADGWELALSVWHGADAAFTRHGEPPHRPVEADTAPLAITLAALRAVGAEIPQEPKPESAA